MVDRLRVGGRRRIGSVGRGSGLTPENGLDEALLGGAVVRHVIVDPQRCLLASAATEHDLHVLRLHALDAGQLLDVAADLEHGTGLDVPRQLRVGDLIVIWPPDRGSLRRLDPLQEVGVAEPSAIEKCGLEDDIGARCHGRDRLLGLATDALTALVNVVPSDLDHGAPARRQIGEVALLVLEASLADHVKLGVRAHRSLHESRQRRALQRRQMLAGQVSNEVSRREYWLAVDQLHCTLHRMPRRVANIRDSSRVTWRRTIERAHLHPVHHLAEGEPIRADSVRRVHATVTIALNVCRSSS